jgi:hypothetical protein
MCSLFSVQSAYGLKVVHTSAKENVICVLNFDSKRIFINHI